MILEVLNQIGIQSSFLKQIRIPKLSDKELIAINLTAEYMVLTVNINPLEYYLNLFYP